MAVKNVHCLKTLKKDISNLDYTFWANYTRI